MKKYIDFFVAITLACGAAASANASTIFLASYGTTAVNPGVANTAVAYDPLSSTVNNGSTTTFNISPGSTWHAALPGSSYVSFNAGTAPGGGDVVPNGDYFYKTSFTLSAADLGIGTMTVLADDTVSIFLNGVMILASAGPMGPGNSYARCSDTGPNCLTPLTFSFSGLQAGVNQLTFDVKQVNAANEGLDFAGAISSVPEPASLALLGTGLIGLVGVSRRYIAAR